MLPPADEALVARDAALPALAVLLDPEQLEALLGGPVVRRSLRYKPGTSCVLGLLVDGQPAYVSAQPPGADKLDKSVQRASEGTLLHVDRARGLLAARPAADRDLGALAALASPAPAARLLAGLGDALADDLPAALADAEIALLSYNPHRRWVARLTPPHGDPVVLRVQRPADAAAGARAAGALRTGEPRTPRVIARRARRGITLLEWLPGTTLDTGALDGDGPAAAGRALARLHGRRLGRLGRLEVPDPAGPRALHAAAAAVGVVLPELGARARDLADRLAPELALGGRRVVLHGDFSLDQVVLGPDGRVGLVDLDRVRVGEPAADLASAEASALAGAGPDRQRLAGALARGYAELAALPDERRLAVHAAAALLRLAVEPFRRCHPDWPAEVAGLLEVAGQRAP